MQRTKTVRPGTVTCPTSAMWVTLPKWDTGDGSPFPRSILQAAAIRIIGTARTVPISQSPVPVVPRHRNARPPPFSVILNGAQRNEGSQGLCLRHGIIAVTPSLALRSFADAQDDKERWSTTAPVRRPLAAAALLCTEIILTRRDRRPRRSVISQCDDCRWTKKR